MENEVRDRAGGPRGRRAARCHEVKIFCPRDVYEHVRAEIGPPIDDGRDPSDGGDPARCAGGLVHLAHLGGRRERASNAKTSKPRKRHHSLLWFCTPGHADTIVLTLEHQLASKPSQILKRIVNHESARL